MTRKRTWSTGPRRRPRSTRTTTTSSLQGAVIALGANLGEPRRQLLQALVELGRTLGPLQVAPPYRSAAVSRIPQPPFLNTVVVATAPPLEPLELLAFGKLLERRAGRQPGPRHAPRPLDVDLLLWNEAEIDLPGLTVPHPRLRQRSFVLAPLAHLLPDLRLPPDGRSPRELMAALPPDPTLRRLHWAGSTGS